jgi:hypothetical protein
MWSIKKTVKNSMSAFDAFENLFGKSVTTFAPAKASIAPKKAPTKTVKKATPKKDKATPKKAVKFGGGKKVSRPKNLPGKFGTKPVKRRK